MSFVNLGCANGVYAGGGKFAESEKFLMKMHDVYHAWTTFQPHASLRRSDMIMLVSIVKMLNEGDKKVTVSALANRLGQSLPGVSQKITVLEEAGYIERVGDKADRRVTYINLTELGEKMVQVSLRKFLERTQAMLDEMGKEKVDIALEVLDELTIAFKQE